MAYADAVNAGLLVAGSVALSLQPGGASAPPVGSVAFSLSRETSRPVMIVKASGGDDCVGIAHAVQ